MRLEQTVGPYPYPAEPGSGSHERVRHPWPDPAPQERAGDGMETIDMNIEKYSERVRGFMQSAQTMALSRNHQQFTPEHLLKVLLDDEEGLAASLIERAGGDAQGRSRSASKRRSKHCRRSRAATASSIWRSRSPRCLRPPRRWPRRPATASSPSSGCCRRWPSRSRPRRRDILAKAGVTAAGAEPGDQRYPQGPHRRFGERRAGL